VGIRLDITECKIAEQSLKESHEKLIKNNGREEIAPPVLKSAHGSLKFRDILDNASRALLKNLQNASAIEIHFKDARH